MEFCEEKSIRGFMKKKFTRDFLHFRRHLWKVLF